MPSIIETAEVLTDLGLSSSVTAQEYAIIEAAITRAESAVRRYLKYDPVQRTRTEYYPQTDFDYLSRGTVWESEGGQAYLRRIATAATDELQVRNIPIRSITSLWIDYDGRAGTRAGAFAAETLKTEGTDFWPNYDGIDSDGHRICRDGIIRSEGMWPTTPGTVKLISIAGYTADELHGIDFSVDAGQIVEAVVAEAIRRAKKALMGMKSSALGWTSGPLSGEKLGDYSYTADSTLSTKLYGGMYELMPETKEALESFVNYGYSLGG